MIEKEYMNRRKFEKLSNSAKHEYFNKLADVINSLSFKMDEDDIHRCNLGFDYTIELIQKLKKIGYYD